MRVITQTKLRRPGRYEYHYFIEVTAGRWREFCREGNRFGDQTNLPTDDEVRFLAAEAAFPGFDDPGLSAELALAALHEFRGDTEAAMEARKRWLAFRINSFTHLRSCSLQMKKSHRR